MRRLCASIALVSALFPTISGCLNFVEPEPGPGQFEAFVRIAVHGERRTHFDARFLPGSSEEGKIRSVEDSVIRFLETSVAPSQESSPTQWTYIHTFSSGLDPDERSVVELIGPRLHGEGSRGAITAPLVFRTGPGSLRLTGDEEDVKLPLRGVSKLRDADLTELRWSLEIQGDEGPVFNLRGNGNLPDTLKIEHDVLNAASIGASFDAHVAVVLETREPAESAGYATRLHLTMHLYWTITRA